MSKIQKHKFKYKPFFKRPKHSLDLNLKGFLCSCNNREKDCVNESYNLLNKYADLLYPSQINPSTEEAVDIQDELKKELADLKSNENKRFRQVESGAKNLIFISTTLDDPVQLAGAIVSDIEKSKVQQTRYLIRLVPVEITCKAHLKEIEIAFRPLVTKYFKDAPKTFSILYNHRNNSNLNKDEVIKSIADIVFETRSDHKVDLKEAEVSIIIEVIRGVALIGVVPDFIKRKKHNLLALSDQMEEIPMEN